MLDLNPYQLVQKTKHKDDNGPFPSYAALFFPKKLMNMYFAVAQLYSLPCSFFCLRKNVTNLHTIKHLKAAVRI